MRPYAPVTATSHAAGRMRPDLTREDVAWARAPLGTTRTRARRAHSRRAPWPARGIRSLLRHRLGHDQPSVRASRDRPRPHRHEPGRVARSSESRIRERLPGRAGFFGGLTDMASMSSLLPSCLALSRCLNQRLGNVGRTAAKGLGPIGDVAPILGSYVLVFFFYQFSIYARTYQTGHGEHVLPLVV